MSPLQILTDLLRRLPSSVRRTLYTVLALLGLALALADWLGVTSIGSVSMSRALELYAYISPAMGLVAVANVGAVETLPTSTADPVSPTDQPT